MKQYILTLSFALLCMFCVTTVNAQNANDSTKQELIQLPFGQVTENRLVSAVDVMTGDDLSHSPLQSVSNAMVGQVSGFSMSRVRGYARGGNNDGPLYIIDGLSNRSIGSLNVEEIESVHVLKDVTAKMLYGSRAANGVIVIKTKRGVVGDKQISFSAEYGIRNVIEYPEYLGSAEYMGYRNQAMMNDGKDPLYTDEDISLAGTSYKYPDVDYYDMFANNQSSFQRINGQLTGGDDKTRYFFNLGYLGADGLEKVGDTERVSVLNVRSNLDYKVNQIVSVNLDIAGRFYMVEGNHIGSNGMFSRLSSAKPNDYPMFISPEANVDSLGTSDKVGGGNLYGDMVYSGYKRQETSFAQTNIGMNFNLNQYIDGLSAKAYATFDINNYLAEGKQLSYRTLKPALTAEGIDTLIVNGVNNPKGSENKIADSYYRNMGGGAQINYDKVFGDHAITGTLSYLVDMKTVKTDAGNMNTVQDDKGMNYGMRLNYAFKNKYIAEYSGSYMGSSRFSPENRWKLFNAFGASYVLSEEDFMSDVEAIDFLKLKTSFGTIGYDQSFEYLLFNDYYQYWSGSYNTGVKNAETLVGTQFTQAGNPDLTFEQSTEFNFGLQLRALDNRLDFSAEFYTEQRTGMPTNMQYAYPKLSGSPTVVANYNAIDTKGLEFSAQFSDQVGDFSYSVGGNLSQFTSTWSQYDELNEFAYMNREGTRTDAIWGYVADGFYTNMDDVTSYGAEDGVGLTSSLGTVIPGDLKIKDMSDEQTEYTWTDNVINKYDQTIIGYSAPKFVYGVNVNLKYKNISFYALGHGIGSRDRTTAWNSYYTNKGNVKYSKFAHEAAVPTFDDEGNAVGLANSDYTLPRLTTEGSAHSYSGNSYFIRKSSYFKLRTLELKYQMPKAVSNAIGAGQFDVFVRGDNLVILSNEKDLDPEGYSYGITTSPKMATVSLGLKIVY